MFEPDQYTLLDVGGGRKLERVGRAVLDRPSPAAEGIVVDDPSRWDAATARYHAGRGGEGDWEILSPDHPSDPTWTVAFDGFQLGLALRPSANIGLFPEHAETWAWLAPQIERRRGEEADRAPKMLNLFAYTGGATLAAAAAGAEVTHVDSSGPSVAWARRNAEASGLEGRPIRWLVEDAVRFVSRAVRRGDRYDGVILDPPTYGHGPKGRPFKFGHHLDELLAGCGALLRDGDPGFLVLSAHAPGFGVADVESAVAAVVPQRGTLEASPLRLVAADGPRLDAGVVARWAG